MFWSYQTQESEVGYKEVWETKAGSYKAKLICLYSMQYTITYTKGDTVISTQVIYVNDLELAKEIANKVLTTFVVDRA